MKKRILITGSTGYVGQHLTQRLLASPQSEIYTFNRTYDIRIPAERSLEGNLLTANLLGWLAEVKPDVVYHCIGTEPRAPFEHQMLIHAEGTRRLLQAFIDNGQSPRVIMTGSASEYGLQNEAIDENIECRPDGEFGISKLSQTMIAQSFARRYDLPVVIGRIFNVYGQSPRHMTVASIASQIAHAELVYPDYSELHVYNLRSRRDFIHIDDVVDALIALSGLSTQNELSGQVYNIGSGVSTAVSVLLDTLLENCRLDSKALKKVSMRLHGVQHEDNSYADIAKIRQHTGWVPQVTLERGLRRELNFWRIHSAIGVPIG
jgi:nucleoside-diphosphate-sugar epimerase